MRYQKIIRGYDLFWYTLVLFEINSVRHELVFSKTLSDYFYERKVIAHRRPILKHLRTNFSRPVQSRILYLEGACVLNKMNKPKCMFRKETCLLFVMLTLKSTELVTTAGYKLVIVMKVMTSSLARHDLPGAWRAWTYIDITPLALFY